ncbi:MAG: ABC transporter ATP-binding protein [Candidatus Ranarchaeia archaeon]
MEEESGLMGLKKASLSGRKAILMIRVSKQYFNETSISVLDDLTVEIEAGSFTVVTGVSGSGKTTFLNLISGLDRPTSGKIIVLGTDLSILREAELSNWRLRNIGFVFQDYNLISTFTASENLSFPLELKDPEIDSGVLDGIVEHMLRSVGLFHRRNHLPGQLSGGEQQRLALARALITDPPIILADEPTGNLDENTARKIRRILFEANSSGKTLVVATHDRSLIAKANQEISLPYLAVND